MLHIETDDQGLARGVRFVRDGRTYSQPAKVVLVGTYVFENSRLLLLSTSKAHPAGLGNDRGQVGRNWMSHVFPLTYGRFPGRRLNLFNGNGSQVTCIDDFNADNFDHAGEAFVGGGMITNTHELAPLMFARGTPHPPYIPRWGSAWKAWMKENAQSVGSIYAQFDALPYEDNGLDLDPAATDPHGVPVVRVTHRIHPNEHAACAFIARRQAELAAGDGRRGGLGRTRPVRGGAPLRGRDADGRGPRHLGRRRLGHRPRDAEPRRPRRVGRSPPSAAATRRSRCRRSPGARRSASSTTGERSPARDRIRA